MQYIHEQSNLRKESHAYQSDPVLRIQKSHSTLQRAPSPEINQKGTVNHYQHQPCHRPKSGIISQKNGQVRLVVICEDSEVTYYTL